MLSYIGGKSRISKFIIPHIPRDIKIFSEVFGGMMWVFHKMNISEFPNLETIVYNDYNQLNTNLFNCVKNYDELSKVINTYETQNAELFYKSQKEIFDEEFIVDLSEPDYDTASKYACVLSQIFSGSKPDKSKFIDLKGKYKSKFDTFKDKLINPKWQSKFNEITNIENMDFEDCINMYDSKDSFHYVDAPYYECEKYYSNHDFGLESHERLAKCLHKIEGRFAMSYYYFDKLEEWFPKDKYRWVSAEFAKASGATAGKEQSMATELLIMNY